MTLASTASSLAGFLVIAGLIMSLVGLYLFVLTVGYLRAGREAFRRYLEATGPRESYTQRPPSTPPDVPEKRWP